ncbi:S-formylglutathione hydrolase FrmB [Amycolatopsis bartoniae]|uniref:Esterase family protein n=1 Tax=Amycolatopsis bartoniae TaxID=941986 RepID=A0A8H9IY36_9PSEU|nr:alpha/beta hydrolase-fold protein [Amycolatopsis bartoniae]MBB2938650.1 S-formylglutathione hydrolase FrmB [Amycolatopsis bartoniae]TVT08855.1 hypothetical protein FNH07_10760 [Amycolatopsis bartoniae]GHF69474.1 hypothetical protein GCM10017566_48930 [Amycolatopsis bartoniae]
MNALAGLSLTGWWPVRVLLLAALVPAGLLVARCRRGRGRVAAGSVALLLVAVNVLTFVNASVGYYRTLGQALGLPGGDAAVDAPRAPASGMVTSIEIPGRTSGFPARAAQVYLPPAWFAHPRPKLPVVVLLHGTPGSPADWDDDGGAASTLDAWAAGHRGVAPVVVMPDINGGFDRDTECVDSPAGRAETYLAEDVPAFVVSRFSTQPPGRRWAVAGLSEGGSCALMLALRHSDRFAVFADYSGLAGPRSGDGNAVGETIATLFGNSLANFRSHEPGWLLTHQRYPELSGWFETGDQDPAPLAAIRRLEPLAEAAGVSAELVVVPGGGHDFFLWRRAFADSLPWLLTRLGG